MNREGVVLLRALIDKSDGLGVLIREGNCKAIAIALNAFLPGDLEIFPADVFAAIKDRPDFGGVKMNVEILRARIDAMPVLFSARLSGDHQAILNEIVRESPEVTIAEVKAAMELRAVPQPSLTSSGAAALVGRARVG